MLNKEILKRNNEIKEEIKERSVGYIVTALGLVAGLAWNEAVKSLIEYLFPLNQNTLWAKFFYAGVLTLFVVVITSYLARSVKRQSVKRQKNY